MSKLHYFFSERKLSIINSNHKKATHFNKIACKCHEYINQKIPLDELHGLINKDSSAICQIILMKNKDNNTVSYKNLLF